MIISKIEESNILGVKILSPAIYEDARGYFLESFNSSDFEKIGLPSVFLQDNQVFSTKNVLRGLHYQLKFPQGKLVSVTQGEVFDVAVDIRQGSPTFGKSIGVHISDRNHKIMYLPEGLAHGYIVLSDTAIFQYKCTDVYHPEDDFGVHWNDKTIDIHWPVLNPILSSKDKILPALHSIKKEHLPNF